MSQLDHLRSRSLDIDGELSLGQGYSDIFLISPRGSWAVDQLFSLLSASLGTQIVGQDSHGMW